MSQTCQIFKKQGDGSLQLIETAADVDCARRV